MCIDLFPGDLYSSSMYYPPSYPVVSRGWSFPSVTVRPWISNDWQPYSFRAQPWNRGHCGIRPNNFGWGGTRMSLAGYPVRRW